MASNDTSRRLAESYRLVLVSPRGSVVLTTRPLLQTSVAVLPRASVLVRRSPVLGS
jgi:hypothetical protein